MKIHAVLVRSEYSSNVGSAARALANMGGDRLILIDPKCELDERARQMAAGAQFKLQEAISYPSWQEFYAREPDGVRIALTRRGGRNRKVDPLPEKLSSLAAEQLPKHLYLIFGPEADGLDHEDLVLVNYACHLPIYGEFGSMNLAQAVMLTTYIARSQFPPSEMPLQVSGETDEPVLPFYFPDELIKEWLVAMGFDVNARKASAFLTLRRLFLVNRPTRHEVQVLEAVLQQNIRKLRSLSFAADE
jgi:TrmH family RNA methyltransferase